MEDPHSDDETQSTGTMPRWVKVSLLIGVAVVLLFVVGKLTGVGGDHGPGRHGGYPAPSVGGEADHRSAPNHDL